MAKTAPDPGDHFTQNDVTFTAVTEEKFTAHSVADTNGEDLVNLQLSKEGTISAVGHFGLSVSGEDWPRLADMLKEKLFNTRDAWRVQRQVLRAEFDALPDYVGHSGKRVGNVILRLRSDGNVDACSLTDETAADTAIVVIYTQGILQVGDAGNIEETWASAIKRLTQIYGQYEADSRHL